jgi:hypothetical protein
VTAFPVWFLLALPGLPLWAFEGSRFTPTVSVPDRPMPPRTRGRRLRVLAWLAGLCCGVLALLLLIWVGIPVTAVLVTVRDWRLHSKLTYGAPPGRVPDYALYMFFLVGVLVYVVPRSKVVYPRVPPGAAVAAMLWFLIHVYAFFRLFDGSPGRQLILGVGLLLALAITNGSLYKLTIPGLEAWYASPAKPARNVEEGDAPEAVTSSEGSLRPRRPERVKLNEVTLPSAKTPPAVDRPQPFGHEPILDAWRARFPDDGPKPKLAVLCVSGGALRSGLWSAVVLEALREKLGSRGVDFDAHVRLITGASGGMLGTAAYVAQMHHRLLGVSGSPYRARTLVDVLTRDGSGKARESLSAVARRIALYDLISIFDPRRQHDDRGRTLEETWSEFLPQSFGELQPYEEAGTLPSLVFAPMFVEDGRRLLISNLDFDFLTKTRGPILVDDLSKEKYGDYFSQEALELKVLFPDPFPNFLVRTAVRLNASFPYVSPAVSLPTEPPRRPVDAGYYDNFGVNIAVRWVEKHRPWLETNTGGVAIIQIRDHLGQKDRFEFTDDVGFWAWLNRGVSFLTAPLAGAYKARSATTSFRNDEQLALLTSSVPSPFFFTTVIFEFQNDGEVALNWQLSEEEITQLGNGIKGNEGRLNRLVDWWTA